MCRDSSQGRIVITHGTDTMIQTAGYLGERITSKIIVLTGAYKPETFKDSDADFNVGFALGAARCINKYGVYLAMNGAVHCCDKVLRDVKTGQFRSKL